LSFDESGADRYIEVKTTKLGKETPASVSPNSFNCGNLGANTVTLTVNDGNGNTNTCIATVTVQDNIPPVAQCKNVTVNLNSSGQASVTAAQVDNGSSDNCPVSLSLNNSNFDCSDIGPNTVTLTVTDNSNNQSTCDATITVEDNTRPSITLQPEIFLWPPNHQYAVIPVTDMVANVNDNCGGSGISDVVITHATSDEAEDDPGPDDESTLNDIVIAAGCKSVSLRRERMEGGNGRVYNVHLSLTDLGGNTVTAQFKVKVKNNNSNNGTAIEDAVMYSKNCTVSMLATPVSGKKDVFQSAQNPKGIVVSHNPANTEVTVTVEKQFSEGSLSLYDTAGRLLMKQELDLETSMYRLDLKQIKSGIYLIQTVLDGQKFTEKIIVR
jgi:hypothetical protein